MVVSGLLRRVFEAVVIQILRRLRVVVFVLDVAGETLWVNTVAWFWIFCNGSHKNRENSNSATRYLPLGTNCCQVFQGT
jgi:hypothetical protein